MFSNESEPYQQLPVHLGIVMDGNGRWAKKHSKPRSFGHKAGLDTVKIIVKEAADLGIKYLTLYIFSTENWKRTEVEVNYLMGLIRNHLRAEFKFYKDNNIRVLYTGDKTRLPNDIQNDINNIIKETSHYSGLSINLAINYGGRNEIVRAVNKFQLNHPGKEITEQDIALYLDNPEIPDVDLIIRTGGDIRLSNFLLWRSAYTEFYFDHKFWPDWSVKDLHKVLKDYQSRERRYGGIKS